MKVEMRPVIDIWSLSDALEAQYNWELDAHMVCQLMFDDNYCNDCYKSYWFSEDEKYEGYSWQNETRIMQENLIKSFLRDLMPDYDRVLVDVSW